MNDRQTLLDEIAAGLSLTDALDDPRSARAILNDLVLAIDGFGPVRTTKALTRARLAPWLRASRLTELQRERLLAVVGEEE